GYLVPERTLGCRKPRRSPRRGSGVRPPSRPRRQRPPARKSRRAGAGRIEEVPAGGDEAPAVSELLQAGAARPGRGEVIRPKRNPGGADRCAAWILGCEYAVATVGLAPVIQGQMRPAQRLWQIGTALLRIPAELPALRNPLCEPPFQLQRPP